MEKEELIIVNQLNGELSLPQQVANDIRQLELNLARMKEEERLFKEKLLEVMRERNIKSIDAGTLKITLIDEQEKTIFDSKQLKADNPELFDLYTKTSKVAPSIKITTRNKDLD